jgi:periplasmic divalent cation tolerance protein
LVEAKEIVIFITSANIEEAQQIADTLLNQRKVACVSVIPGMKSFFWWQGKRESASEVLLTAKSRASLLPEIIDLVKQVHSYEVPEIIALPVFGGNRDYLEWIYGETKVEGKD